MIIPKKKKLIIIESNNNSSNNKIKTFSHTGACQKKGIFNVNLFERRGRGGRKQTKYTGALENGLCVGWKCVCLPGGSINQGMARQGLQ